MSNTTNILHYIYSSLRESRDDKSHLSVVFFAEKSLTTFPCYRCYVTAASVHPRESSISDDFVHLFSFKRHSNKHSLRTLVIIHCFISNQRLRFVSNEFNMHFVLTQQVSSATNFVTVLSEIFSGS